MTTTVGPSAPVPTGRDFTAFYRAHRTSIARALGVTLGNHELGAEAADEAMARCYSRWSKVKTYDNPAGWVYRVGLNWAVSARRRQARHLNGAQPDPAAAEPAVGDPCVEQALRSLALDLRSVVVCRLLLDWSVEQTALALGIPQGTVKSRLHRALNLLERKLDHLRQESI